MSSNKLLYISLIAAAVFSASAGFAQSKRGLMNDGVEMYHQKKYNDAEVKFKKGLEKDPKMFEGHFDLGDTYYKQGRYDEAVQSFKKSLEFTKDKSDQAKVFHNIGNSLLKGKKYEESVGAFKNSLKLNPKDKDTKYNLSYALNMMKQNQNQNKQNKNDKNKDKNKDQQNQNKNQQNNQDKNKDKQNQQQQQQPQPKNQISKEEAQRMLDALKNNESDMQKKLRKDKGRPVATDKDW
jgi:Ca-activated chloride channel homolog